MFGFEQELSKYLVSKFVLKYNIKPWGVFHPVCCWCMLLWVVSGVFRNRCVKNAPWFSSDYMAKNKYRLPFFERSVLQLKLILFKYFFLVSLLHATITSSADILRVATSTKEEKVCKEETNIKRNVFQGKTS